MSIRVSPSLQSGYDEQYTDALSAWRELGGKYKAQNIIALARGLEAKKVLDCGAGEGSVLHWLDQAGCFEELHAVEISQSGIQYIERRRLGSVRTVQKFDGYHIPHENGAFDVAIASHVIEHVEHPRLLLRELARVSKYQIMEVPLDYRVGIDREVQGQLRIGHINIFTPALFRFLVRSEGFEILDERLTKLTRDVLRYNWYQNERRRFDLVAEVKLLYSPLSSWIKKLFKGRKAYEERAFDALTVLTRVAGELKIFGPADSSKSVSNEG